MSHYEIKIPWYLDAGYSARAAAILQQMGFDINRVEPMTYVAEDDIFRFTYVDGTVWEVDLTNYKQRYEADGEWTEWRGMYE